jgi:hypothetical protein
LSSVPLDLARTTTVPGATSGPLNSIWAGMALSVGLTTSLDRNSSTVLGLASPGFFGPSPLLAMTATPAPPTTSTTAAMPPNFQDLRMVPPNRSLIQTFAV